MIKLEIPQDNNEQENNEQELIIMLKKVVDQAKRSGYKEGSRRLFGKDDFTEVVLEAEEVLKKYKKHC